MTKVKFFPNSVFGTDVLPQRAHDTDAGFDLTSINDDWLAPGETKLFKCGFRMSLEPGYEAQIRPRSGLSLKHGIHVLNSPGTIDAGYRGDVGVILHNSGEKVYHVQAGKTRIAQMVINKLPEVEVEVVKSEDELGQSERSTGGLGSTGINNSLPMNGWKYREKVEKETAFNED